MQELVEGEVYHYLNVGELRAWYGVRKVFLEDNETDLDREVRHALLMIQHVDDGDELINQEYISDWLRESARDLYGQVVFDVLSAFMDWEAYENAVLMDWDTVTINGSDWWFRK